MSADGQVKAGKTSRQQLAHILSGGAKGPSSILGNIGSAASRSISGISRPASVASVTSAHSEGSFTKKVSPSKIPGVPMSEKAKEDYKAKHKQELMRKDKALSSKSVAAGVSVIDSTSHRPLISAEQSALRAEVHDEHYGTTGSRVLATSQFGDDGQDMAAVANDNDQHRASALTDREARSSSSSSSYDAATGS